MNAFQVSEAQIPVTVAKREPLLGEQMFSVAALSHFEVAVSSIVIAPAAFLILPWYRARRVAEPIANIDVCAVTAWDRPPAAAVLKGIIAARLKLRRHHPVRVALAVSLIDIVAVAARRWMAVTAVPDFLRQGDAFVHRVGRYSQL
jgi:hypothetical protein